MRRRWWTNSSRFRTSWRPDAFPSPVPSSPAVAATTAARLAVEGLDDKLTRCGDGGIDLEIDDTQVDVKTVKWGYDRGKVPLLKVRQVKHEETMRRLEDEDDDLNALMYYLVERVDASTARLIGYIDAEVFDEVCQSITEGETYKADDPRYDWTSRDDNYFCEPEQLWLSYRDD
jgi:hypothetical protein